MTPAALAAATASAAKVAGGRSAGGVLTQSRARCTASTTVCARATAALTALSRPEPLTRLNDSTAGLILLLLVTR